MCGLRNPELFLSISAFAPITNPSITSWGKEKVFKNYLGDDNKELWASYDSCEVIKRYTGPPREILADQVENPKQAHLCIYQFFNSIIQNSSLQGDSDEFLQQILRPENLIAAAGQSPHHVKVTLRMQPGYNHSYFFVQSFIPDHIAHHAKILNAP